MKLAAALLVLVACGDNLDPPVTAAPHSGDRLRLVDEHWEDLVRLRPETMFDRERDVECTPTIWSDGHRYCTPDAPKNIAYLDDACTQPIALWSAASEVPAYYRQLYFGETPPRVTKVFRRGDPVDVPTAYYDKTSSGCLMRSPDAASTAYAATALTADDFVRVTLLPLDADADRRIQRSAYGSADGMQLETVDDRFDRELDLPCTWTAHAGEAKTICAPAATDAAYYREATCTTPLVDVTQSTPAGLIRYVDAETACPRYGALEESFAFPTMVWRRANGGCELSISPATSTLKLRSVIPIDIATLARTRLDEGHRLQRIERTEVDALDETHLYDTMLLTECERIGDVCIPVPTPTFAAAEATYADPACTTPQPIVLARGPYCGDAPRYTVQSSLDGEPPMVRPLTRFTAPLYRVSTGEVCAPYEPVDAETYAVGELLPPTAFARASDTHR